MQRKWWEEEELVAQGPASHVPPSQRSQMPLVHQGPPREPTPATPNQNDLDAANAAQSRAATAKAEAETARILQQPDPSDINPADPKNRGKIANLNAIVSQVNRVQELYDQHIAPTSGLSGLLDWLPTDANRQFDTAGAGLGEQGLASFRTPGVGSQSDREFIEFIMANRPSSTDRDVSIEEKLRSLRTRIDATREQFGLPAAQWGGQGQPEQDRQAPPVVGSTTQPQPPVGPPPPGAPQQGRDFSTRLDGPSRNDVDTTGLVAPGAMKRENDPVLAGINAHMTRMIVNGASQGEINAYYKRVAGESAGQYPLDQNALREAIQWQRRTHDKRGPIFNADDRMVPLGLGTSLMNNAAQSPLGAYGMAAGDAVTFGTLDNLTSNPALTRAGMDEVRRQNPKMSLAGTVTGGALAAGGLEAGVGAGLARVGLAEVAPKVAPIVGDVLYGGGYGAGSADEGSRLAGAAIGAVAGGAGGVAGRKVVSGLGRAATGTRDAATRLLTERGIPLTLGQMAGRGGIPGRVIGKMEDALESVPILGSAIARRRAEGTEAFNAAAFREAGDPIRGAPGKQIDPRVTGDLPTTGLAPANVAEDGKIYVGREGGLHFEVADRFPEARFTGDVGFVTPGGQYLTREQALAWAEKAGNRIRPSENMGKSLDAMDYREQRGSRPPQTTRDPAPNPVTAIGETGVEQAQAVTSDAYRQALGGVQVKSDPVFAKDMKRAIAAGQKLHSETAEDFRLIIEDQVAPAFAKGPLSGEEYQAIRQVLRQERAAWKGKPRGQQYGAALRQVEGALEALVRRRAPGVAENLNAADRAYRLSGVVRDAVGRGKNTGGTFTPAQLGMAAEANARKFGGAATTQRPFFELQRAGQDVLPSRVANSGTADRIMAAGMLPALASASSGAAAMDWIDPKTAALLTALGLPFTKGGRATLQTLMVKRPDLVRSAGEKILAAKPIGGLLGAPIGASLAPQQ